MKLGLVTYKMAAEWTVDNIIQNCEKYGFDGVELRTTHKHGVEPDLSKQERDYVKKRFSDSSVVLWGLGTVCEFHALTMTEVDKNVNEANDFIELAQDVGAVGIKVRPNGFQVQAGVEKARTIDQIGKAFARVGEFGKDHGIEVWMEVHGADTSLPENMKRILEAADHDNCYACWNSNKTDLDENGSIDENFALLKHWIRSCHINELPNRSYPYKRLFSLLEDAGYGERFTLAEIQGTSDPDRFLTYYRALWEEMTCDR